MTATQDFAERIVGAVDSASLAILLSIGHQTRLFDTMAELPPASSTQIADAAGLNERYVREWLGGMVASQVIELRPALRPLTFCPVNTRWSSPRKAGPDNLARVSQFISLLGEVEQKIIGCFHNGGGLPYSEYPRFHKLMAEQSGEVFDAALVDVVLPLVGRPARAVAQRRRCRRHRLRQWPCRQRDGAGIPGEQVHRNRFLRRGRWPSDGRRRSGCGLDNATFVARDVGRTRHHRGASTSSPRSTRSTTRRIPPRAGEHPPRAAARRRAADGRHQGVEQRGGQRRVCRWPPTSTPSRRCTA